MPRELLPPPGEADFGRQEAGVDPEMELYSQGLLDVPESGHGRDLAAYNTALRLGKIKLEDLDVDIVQELLDGGHISESTLASLLDDLKSNARPARPARPGRHAVARRRMAVAIPPGTSTYPASPSIPKAVGHPKRR